MLEPIVRASLPRLQAIYDRCPPSARDFLTSARGLLLARIRYAPASVELLAELRRHESWTIAQIRDRQLAALQQIVAHARATVEFYERYAPAPLRSIDDLRLLPVLTRETVRRNPHLLLSRAIQRRHRIRAATTGTTGASLAVAYTEELARHNWAFLLRQWAWAGVGAFSPRITLFGSRVVPACRARPPYWTFNRAERQHLLSIFHISDASAPDYLAFIRARSGAVLEGFPSALAILADFALRRGEPVPMRVVFTSGEPLYPSARAKIEAAYQAPVFDHYGMTEYCGLIQQCERGRMHLIPEFGFLEILDEENQPVRPGDEGYFVWTGFLNRAMPLIRYRIGDRGRWLPGETCPCGRAFSLVVPTITRESDLLHCPDGRVFSPRALNQLLKGATALRFCQFVRAHQNYLFVRAVAGDGPAAEEAARIAAALQAMIGPSMIVTAALASGPIVRPGGKIPLIVNDPAGPVLPAQEGRALSPDTSR